MRCEASDASDPPEKLRPLAPRPGARATGRNPGGRPSLGQTTVHIYRNNVFASLTDALATRFPVCPLVGDEFFRALAGVFVELSPPRSPVLMFYGDEFATFIDTFPPASSVPYLGDVARLEAGRTHAYHAADGEPLSVNDFAASRPVPGSGCGWRSTPPSNSSPRPIRSSRSGRRTSSRAARHPFRSLLPRMRWLAAQSRGRGPAALPGGSVFLSRLAGHATLGEAFEGAAAAELKFDLVANLTALLVSRIVVGLSMDC